MRYKVSLISFFVLLAINSKIYCQSQQDLLYLEPRDSIENLTSSRLVNSVLIDFRQRYIYNHSKDTIFLPDIDTYGLYTCDEPKIVSEIQIDGKGAKEIVFYRKCTSTNTFYISSYAQHTSARIKKYEVWNLDHKTLLFEATNYYKGQSAGTRPNRFRRLKPYKNNLYYQYNFSIDKTGKIEIKHLRGQQKQQVKLQEGVYLFKNGAYKLQQ